MVHRDVKSLTCEQSGRAPLWTIPLRLVNIAPFPAKKFLSSTMFMVTSIDRGGTDLVQTDKFAREIPSNNTLQIRHCKLQVEHYPGTECLQWYADFFGSYCGKSLTRLELYLQSHLPGIQNDQADPKITRRPRKDDKPRHVFLWKVHYTDCCKKLILLIIYVKGAHSSVTYFCFWKSIEEFVFSSVEPASSYAVLLRFLFYLPSVWCMK